MDWLSAVQQLRREGRPGVLVTVVEVRGHAPRDAGAKMVVGTDQVWGSVGGGNLEEAAITRARELIGSGELEPQWQESALSEHAANPHGQQCCGGVVRLLLEPLAVRPTVAIFGVGHVGHELGRILSRLEIQLHLVDSRPDQLDPLRLADVTDGVADVVVHQSIAPESVLHRLPREAHVLIMTHDHAEDLTLCEAALRTPDLGTIGLIGSAAKWSRFKVQLAAEGHPAEQVARITCPIGLPDLVGKEPAVIAVGVATELVRAMERSAQRASAR
jgi:xanthine dehydrogenase accessory factor